jgi:CubicO group peptidase (beta-lactamase class C family)
VYFKNIILIAFLVVTPAVVVIAQGLPSTTPERVGLSEERLLRIGNAIRQDVADDKIAGALAMVARNGKIAYVDYAGMADMEKKVPMGPETIFRIYSMSKPITSVAVMMLFEEGHFFLDDPVGKFIPELAKMEVIDAEELTNGDAGVFNLPDVSDADKVITKVQKLDVHTHAQKRPITIRDLLRHSAGLTYGFFGNTPVDKMYQMNGILVSDQNLEDFVRKLGQIPLQFQPGERWHYSVSVDVLGRLVEVVSGQSFDVFLQERIFNPLGMVDTGFYAPEEKLDRLATLYAPDGEGSIIPADPLLSRNFVAKPKTFSGGGGLVATAGDYMRFSQMLLNGGELDGVRIISRKTIEMMTTDHTEGLPSGYRAPGYGFGLGFAVSENRGLHGGPATEGEFNWGGAAGTKFWVDPEENLIAVYMIQILPHGGLRYGDVFKNLVYQSIDD